MFAVSIYKQNSKQTREQWANIELQYNSLQWKAFIVETLWM